MMGRAQALLAKMAKKVSSRLRAFRLRSARKGDGDGAPRDPLASYAAPSHRSKEPPYVSLRQ
jgi:hypothetical protein